jgi:hypothetical protein
VPVGEKVVVLVLVLVEHGQVRRRGKVGHAGWPHPTVTANINKGTASRDFYRKFAGVKFFRLSSAHRLKTPPLIQNIGFSITQRFD